MCECIIVSLHASAFRYIDSGPWLAICLGRARWLWIYFFIALPSVLQIRELHARIYDAAAALLS